MFPFRRHQAADPPAPETWWNCIYFHHIGKTSGMSYRNLFESLFRPEEVFRAQWLDQSAFNQSLQSYRLFQGHFPFEFRRYLPQPCLIYTVLREPRQHVLSTFNHLRRLGTGHVVLAHRSAPLQDIADALSDEIVRHSLTNMQTLSVGWEPDPAELLLAARNLKDCYMPETFDETLESLKYVLHGAEEINRTSEHLLQIALHRLQFDCAAVGIVEDEAASLSCLQSVLGNITFPERLPRLNQAVDQGTVTRWSDLSPEQQQQIDDITQLDRRFYEAGKQLLSRRMRFLLR